MPAAANKIFANLFWQLIVSVLLQSKCYWETGSKLETDGPGVAQFKWPDMKSRVLLSGNWSKLMLRGAESAWEDERLEKKRDWEPLIHIPSIMQSVSSWNRTRPVLHSCGGILRLGWYVTVSTERVVFAANAAEPERSEITDDRGLIQYTHRSFYLSFRIKSGQKWHLNFILMWCLEAWFWW